MPSKFGGTPVSSTSKFGGSPTTDKVQTIVVDGRTVGIPEGSTPEDIRGIILRAKGNRQSLGGPPIKEKRAPAEFVPEALSAGGAILGGLTGSGVGSIPGTMLGAAAGREIGTGLQQKYPDTFGEPPENPEQAAVVDAIAQGLVIPGLSKAGKFAYDTARIGPRKQIANVLSKSIMNRVSPSLRVAGATSVANEANAGIQGFNKNLTDILDEAATDTSIHRGVLNDTISKARPIPLSPAQRAYMSSNSFNPDKLQNALEDYNSTLGSNKVGQDLLSLNRDIANPKTAATQYYNDIAKKALSDVAEVRNFKLATGNPQAIEDLATTKLLRNATTGKGVFNAEKILQGLEGGDKEIYNEAISKGTRDNLTKLATTLQEAENTINKGAESSGLLKRTGRAIAIAIPTGLVGGPVAAGTVAAANAANEVRLLVDSTMIKRFVSNPENVKLIQAAAKTKFSSPESGIVGKAILGALRGTAVYVMTPQGRQKVVVDDSGKLLPTQ